MHWQRVTALLIISAALGVLAALARPNLGVRVVAAVFLTSFVLIELLPRWRHEPSLLTEHKVVISLIAGSVFWAILYALGRTKLASVISGGDHPWSFLLLVLAVFGLSALLKRRALRK